LRWGEQLSLAAIIQFNSDCPTCAQGRLILRNLHLAGFPIVRKIIPTRSFLDTLQQSGEDFLITIPALPVKELSGNSTGNLPEPKFIFFECK
jgi:hypothetical protein